MFDLYLRYNVIFKWENARKIFSILCMLLVVEQSIASPHQMEWLPTNHSLWQFWHDRQLRIKISKNWTDFGQKCWQPFTSSPGLPSMFAYCSMFQQLRNLLYFGIWGQYLVKLHYQCKTNHFKNKDAKCPYIRPAQNFQGKKCAKPQSKLGQNLTHQFWAL